MTAPKNTSTPPRCAVCDDTGWMTGEATAVPGTADGVSVSMLPCPCGLAEVRGPAAKQQAAMEAEEWQRHALRNLAVPHGILGFGNE